MKYVLSFVAMLAVGAPAAVTARDLAEIARLPNRTIVLIDRASIHAITDGPRQLQEGVVSLDNSRNPVDAARVFASDNRVQADCAAGELRIAWTREYDRDGNLVRSERPVPLYRFAKPDSPAERAALKALCGGK